MVNYIILLKGGGSCTKYFKSLFPFSLTYIETTQKQAEENLRLVAGIASQQLLPLKHLLSLLSQQQG